MEQPAAYKEEQKKKPCSIKVMKGVIVFIEWLEQRRLALRLYWKEEKEEDCASIVFSIEEKRKKCSSPFK